MHPNRNLPLEQLGGMIWSLNRSYSDMALSIDSVSRSVDDFRLGAILLTIFGGVIVSIVTAAFAFMMTDLLENQRQLKCLVADLSEKQARVLQQSADSSSSEKQAPANNPSAEKESSAASCTIETSSQAAQ